MATERIDIVVSERGTRRVRRNIDDLGNSATGAQGAVQLLRRALGALATGAAVAQLVRLVDTFTNLQNRLRNVTTSTAQLNAVTDRLFGIANRTRSSFESTTEVFARSALALKDLGISAEETLQFTESLNQAVILSGASAEEANAALIQLSQGLASGTLRGDELRSVLEQLPSVADVIARGLGVTRGQLRELGEQGKITAQDILSSFRQAREELAERFARTVPTIGQAFTVLRNNIIQFIGGVDQASGASTALAQLILLLADNVEVLGRSFAAAALTIGTIFAARAVRSATLAVRALTLAIAANPLATLAIAITAVISTLVAFSDQLKLTSEGAATLADFFVVAFDEAKAAINALADVALPVFNEIIGFAEGIVGPINLSFAGILRGAGQAVDGVVGVFKGAYNAIVNTFELLPRAIGDLFLQALNGAINIVESALNKLIEGINVVTEFVGVGSIGEVSLGGVTNPLEGRAREAGQTAGAAFVEGFQSVSFASEAVDRILVGAEERAQERLRRQAEEQAERERAQRELGQAGVDRTAGQQSGKLQDFLRDLERENELLQLGNEERAIREALFKAEDAAGRALLDTERQRVEELVRSNLALSRQNDLLDEIKGPHREYSQGVEDLNALLARGAITQGEFNTKLRELRIELLEGQTDTFSGFERGFLKAQQDMEDFASASERLITDAFSEAQDAVVGFFKSGKFEADDFFRTLSDNLLKLGTQQLFASVFGQQGAFGGLFGGGGGGGLFGGGGGGGIGGIIASAIGGLAGFQNGGSFTVGAGTAAARIPGIDNRLVAFRARDGEEVTVTPRNQRGEAPGGPINQVFNITTPDADSFRRSQTQVQNKALSGLNRARSRR